MRGRRCGFGVGFLSRKVAKPKREGSRVGELSRGEQEGGRVEAPRGGGDADRGGRWVAEESGGLGREVGGAMEREGAEGGHGGWSGAKVTGSRVRAGA